MTCYDPDIWSSAQQGRGGEGLVTLMTPCAVDSVMVMRTISSGTVIRREGLTGPLISVSIEAICLDGRRDMQLSLGCRV